MKKLLLAALLLGGATAAAQAHEIWIERDANGPARIYLGEPAEPLPPGGDPEFAKLKNPRVLAAADARLERKSGYLEAQVPAGDVRAWDDNVFAPWGEDGKKEGVVYYARAGRAEARAAMPFEIVPAAANSDRFLVTRDGKAIADVKVTVITPDRWTKAFATDAAGAITVPVREPGRYLLSAAVEDEGAYDTPGGPVTKLHRITTTTFVAK